MINTLIILFINLICGIIVVIWHEFPKNILAHFLTHPIYRGDLKIVSPIKYIDKVGAIMFAFSVFGIGWQKPYEYDVNKFTLKDKGGLILALVGQLFSLLLIFILFPLAYYTYHTGVNEYVVMFLFTLIKFNATLIVVNLFPMISFDMSAIIRGISYETYRSIEINNIYFKFAFLVILGMRLVPQITSFLLSPLFRLIL